MGSVPSGRRMLHKVERVQQVILKDAGQSLASGLVLLLGLGRLDLQVVAPAQEFQGTASLNSLPPSIFGVKSSLLASRSAARFIGLFQSSGAVESRGLGPCRCSGLARVSVSGDGGAGRGAVCAQRGAPRRGRGSSGHSAPGGNAARLSLSRGKPALSVFSPALPGGRPWRVPSADACGPSSRSPHGQGDPLCKCCWCAVWLLLLLSRRRCPRPMSRAPCPMSHALCPTLAAQRSPVRSPAAAAPLTLGAGGFARARRRHRRRAVHRAGAAELQRRWEMGDGR